MITAKMQTLEVVQLTLLPLDARALESMLGDYAAQAHHGTFGTGSIVDADIRLAEHLRDTLRLVLGSAS